MSSQVKNMIKEMRFVSIEDLIEFQGELKDLNEENYLKLRGEIEEMGYSFLIHAWENEGKLFILDGHQRRRVMMKMIEDGVEVPALPIAIVEANSYKQAKEKLLAAASQYGEVTSQGLYEYLAEAGIDWREAVESYRMPEVDWTKFVASYYAENHVTQESSPPPRVNQADNLTSFLNNDLRYLQLVYPIPVYEKMVLAMDDLCKEHDCDDYSTLIQKIVGVESPCED